MRKTMLWIIVSIIIIIGLGVGGYLLYRARTNSQYASPGSPSQAGSIPPSQSTTNSSSSPGTPAPTVHTSSSVVQTLTDPTLGQYLATSDGNTLYTYSGDTTGTSNCTGSCAAAWPAYIASGRPDSLPANVGVISNSNGDTQYTYKGLPLYTFGSETAGQISGDGLSGFHIARP